MEVRAARDGSDVKARPPPLGRRFRQAEAKMPVAVMAENSFSFRKLLEQCETQELEVRRGRARGWRGPGGGPACCGGAGSARSARGFGTGVSSRGGWVRDCRLKVLVSESNLVLHGRLLTALPVRVCEVG